MSQCLKCKSGNVVAGQIGNTTRTGWWSAVFKPDRKTRFLALTLREGTDCDGEAFACLDCGLVWISLCAQDLKEFIEKDCKKPELHT